MLKRCGCSVLSDRSLRFPNFVSASRSQHPPHADAARLSAGEILAVLARHGHLVRGSLQCALALPLVISCRAVLILRSRLLSCACARRGHEHECCQDPVESVEGQYFVLQPGSSVATSLSGGEAVDKKVVIMEIMGDQYRTVPITLTTTRPFVMADTKLADDLDALDTNPQQIEDYLTEKVHELIDNVKR